MLLNLGYSGGLSTDLRENLMALGQEEVVLILMALIAVVTLVTY